MGVVELLKHELLHEYPVRRPRRSRRLGRAAFGPNAPETRPSKASRRSGPRPRPSDGPSGRRASPARALFSAVRCIGQRRRRRRAPRVRDPPCYRAPRAGRFLPSPLEVALQGICPWQRRSPERPRKCSGDEAGMARSAQPRKLEAIAEAWEQARLCRGIQGPKHICSVGKVPFNGPFSAPARSNGPAEKGPAEKGPAEKASTTPKWTGSQVSARAGTDDLDDPGRWLSLVWGTFGRAALVRSLGPFNGPWGRSTVDRAHPRKTRRCHGQNGPTKNGAPSRGGPLCAVRNKPGVGREAFPKGISKRHFFKKADTGGSFKARFPQDGASNKARSEKVAKWAVVQRPPCL
ncbi:hypothetical protein M885DRAFT_139672 [Pelagophyceae sp. CCMP2097]|nr:hypothetical protein M885DRAFT_139672 [Pelagophyceae sp. CCMP2097]